ncbi:MAG: alginate export family protein [Bacteroidales bacterium]|jgi:hypothetical protein|nr:alginate export family protein [Bacteroidales bacterium]NPV35257.1 alginate export family protein [Bacteroidales bacterium]
MNFPAKAKLLILLSIATISTVRAQFSIETEIRPRVEIRNGYQQLIPQHATPAALISQRSRLKFTYQKENLRLVLSPQDVRIWGDEKNNTTSGNVGDEASLDLHEGYAELSLNPHFSFAVGRMELSYDNEWLLGRRNWNQSGIASDAFLLKWTREKWSLHTAFSWNTLKDALRDNYYPTDRYKTLAFCWMNYQPNSQNTLSFLLLSTGQTPSDTVNTQHFRFTTGIYYKINYPFINGDFNLYYQFGKNAINQTVSAFLTSGNISLTTGKLMPGIGWAVSGGNKNPQGNTDHTFDLIYTARHKFLGNMDYFRNLSSHVKQAGLVDFYGSLIWKAPKNFTVQNAFHYFSLLINNSLAPTQKNLALENDFIIRYKMTEWGTLEYGLMVLLPTQGLKELQKVDQPAAPVYTYLMLTISPRVFP